MEQETSQETAQSPGTAWFRVGDVARLLGVSGNTVRRWTDDGVLTSYRSPGGHRRYLRDEVMAAMAAGRTGGGEALLAERLAPAGADLIVSLRRQVETLDASFAAGVDLIRLLLHDPAGVSRLVAEKLAGLTGVPVCEVATVERGALRVIASVEHGHRNAAREGVVLDPEPRRRLAAAADGSQPFAVFTSAQTGLSTQGRELLAERGCGSLLVVPLLVEGTFAGTVELSDADVRDFDREIGIVRGFAEIATQALKVAAFVGKLAARDRAARELVEVSGLASQAKTSDELLRGVTHRLSSAIEASGCDIYGVVGDTLVVVASARRGEQDTALLGAAYELNDYPAAAAAIATREPFIVTDANDPRLTPTDAEHFRASGFVAECMLPLYSGETLVGLLDIFDDESTDFLDFLDLVKGIGQIVADSLVKTRLLSDLGLQNKLMSELVELGAIAPGAGDVGVAFGSLGSRLIDTIGADTCELYSLAGRPGSSCWPASTAPVSPTPWIGWTGDIRDFPCSAAALVPARGARHRLARRPATLRPRARALRRVRLPERDLRAARRRRAGHRLSRHLRHPTARLRRVRRLPAGLRAGAGPHHPERPAAARARAAQRRAARPRDAR